MFSTMPSPNRQKRPEKFGRALPGECSALAIKTVYCCENGGRAFLQSSGMPQGMSFIPGVMRVGLGERLFVSQIMERGNRMLRNTILRKKTGRRLLCMAICLLMSISMLTMAMASDGTSGGLETEQPVLVLTGQGLPGGVRGSADSVSNEKAYTMDELRALEGVAVERLYSSINSFQTKMFFRGQGIDLEDFLALSGYTGKGRITTVASDGYSSTYNLDDDRYFYPNFADGDESGSEPVKPMLAWRSVDNREEPPVQPDPFPTPNEDADEQSLRLLAGQVNAEDVNSNLYARNVNKIVVGDDIDDADITILGEEYARADILLMPRAQRDYEYTGQGGLRTDTVRGVPLAELLKDIGDDIVIRFGTVDNWARISEFTMTKRDLVEKNAILAYEIKGEDGWGAYYRESDDGIGYFRLMTDGTSGGHLINEVSLFFDTDSAPRFNQDEVFAALNEGLIPDAVALAGWQSETSRLAAAETIVVLIEKAADKTMEQLAQEYEWDLTAGGFSDTDNQAVTFLKHAGVVDGVGNNMYDSEAFYTRAAAVTMIGRAAEVFFGIEVQGENPYTDVPAWAAPFVGYAAANNITQGVSAELFNPSGSLQNQHLAIFMIRTLNAWR